MKIFKKALSAATASIMAASMCAIDIGSLAPVNAAGSQTAIDLVNDMGLGWNLGNTFDSWNTKSWADTSKGYVDNEVGFGNVTTTKNMIDTIHQYGFDSVRIPVTWADNTDENTFDINDNYLARIKEVVDYCIDNDMYAIINMHWDWESGGSQWLNKGEGALTQFNTMWTEIANYFKDYDEHLVFEDMNEVTFDYSVLNKFNQNFVDTVRATGGNNSSRLLLLAGANADLTKTCNSSYVLPDDDMIAVDIHYYTPPTFCVAPQDSTWGYTSTWGTSSDKSDLANNFDKLKTTFVDKGVPVIIGEYGVLTNEGKDVDSIRDFNKTVAGTALSMNGISAYLWDDSDSGGHKYFSRKSLSFFDAEMGQIFIDLAGNGYTPSTIDWVPADIVTDDKGTVSVDIGTATKVKLEITGKASSSGTGAIGYWDNNANNGKGGWIQDTIFVKYEIDEDGNGKIYQTTDDTYEEVLSYEYFEIPSTASTSSIQIMYFYGGYWDDAAKKWTDISDSSDYPTLSAAYIPGIADDNTETTTTVTTTAEVVETTTTTVESTEDTPVETTTAEPSGEDETYTGVYANAYLAGSIGASGQWSAKEAATNGTVAEVDGNGTYEVEWKLAEGSETISFLMLEIESIADFDNYFTTDTFPDLSLSIDHLYIDGNEVALADNPKAINLRYFEGTGKTRAYFVANWGANNGEDFGIGEDTTVLESIKVVFTVGGTYKDSENSSEIGETTTTEPVDNDDILYGDANGDGKISLADAVIILQNLANPEKYPMTDAQKKAADVDGVAGVTGADALAIQNYDSGKVEKLPLA